MNIVIIGAGAFGTALGDVLVGNPENTVTLLCRREEISEAINCTHLNPKYFPNFRLNKKLLATTDATILSNADFIFLALPSNSVKNFLSAVKESVNKNAVIINLAKGFSIDNKTIIESLRSEFDEVICSIKGPTFATELIHKLPTGFTVGYESTELYDSFLYMFNDTNIVLDYSEDVIGVEILSILKNMYAILLGIIDAHFNSANVRFLFLTKAFKETRDIIVEFGLKEETLYKYCGFGDFGLTSLNDLSRNRTLGLLIGKGFLSGKISDNVILEGKRSLEIFYNIIMNKTSDYEQFPMIFQLYRLFNSNLSVSDLINSLIRNLKNVPQY